MTASTSAWTPIDNGDGSGPFSGSSFFGPHHDSMCVCVWIDLNLLLSDLQLQERSMLKLDKICREANTMLVIARSYGLTGLVRISLKVM